MKIRMKNNHNIIREAELGFPHGLVSVENSLNCRRKWWVNHDEENASFEVFSSEEWEPMPERKEVWVNIVDTIAMREDKTSNTIHIVGTSVTYQLPAGIRIRKLLGAGHEEPVIVFEQRVDKYR